jgi:hypothetical protein
MNRLGLGTNNFRIIGSAPPPPEFTRYIIGDCVIDGDQYYTLEYGYNDYQINDRVFYNIGVRESYGKVIARTTEIVDELGIQATGVNSANCYNNSLIFTSELFLNDTILNIEFSCNPQNGFFVYNEDIDSYLVYNYNLYIYYEGFNDEGEPVSELFNLVGESAEIGGYSFTPNQANFIFEINENTGDTITFASIDEGQEQPYFGGTQLFSDNNNCSYNYFLQNSTGYSFNASFRNDNC